MNKIAQMRAQRWYYPVMSVAYVVASAALLAILAHKGGVWDLLWGMCLVLGYPLLARWMYNNSEHQEVQCIQEFQDKARAQWEALEAHLIDDKEGRDA